VRQQSLAVTRQRWAIDEAAHYIQQAKFAGGRNLALPVSFPFVTLFRGWQVNCVRAGLFTAGSMATYELCKAEMNKHILEESPVTHITAGTGHETHFGKKIQCQSSSCLTALHRLWQAYRKFSLSHVTILV
jgi:hypothetical protein